MNRIGDAMSNPTDPYNPMLSTNPSHQTEIVPLAKNTTESEYNKTILIQQSRQLYEDILLAQGGLDPDETTFNSHYPPENSTHASQTNKEATINTLDDTESLDNASETTFDATPVHGDGHL